MSGPNDLDETSATRDTLGRALDDLRAEIRARFPIRAVRGEVAGAAAERDRGAVAAPGTDWMELFDELRARVNRLGIRERRGDVDEFGMDPEALRRVRPLLDLLFDRWWRVDVRGVEHVPAHGGTLLVGNHAGLLPWDGLMVSHAVARALPERERVRFLVADWLITRPFAQPWLVRVGGVRACRENAERLISHGHPVLAFPEGVKGSAKVFRERYRLKRFGRGGAVRVAIESRVPLVPVAIVGGEETHPVLFKVERMARLVGLPFLPVTPTFPWLGPLGLLPLPSKWVIRFGEPIPLQELAPEAAEDELLVSRLTEELRQRIQAMVDQGVRSRGSPWA
ncbi:MAG TPA: lysophospholipid acyltransferase family protein [Myxococcota bacterium]|jgi:1-acyl-sn-glycerol-3-phosphate acyltransferase|nr:lysophospholipid acyltransferase family protein [Myxococcota bacterium]